LRVSTLDDRAANRLLDGSKDGFWTEAFCQQSVTLRPAGHLK
jgi:hypothetical protein